MKHREFITQLQLSVFVFVLIVLSACNTAVANDFQHHFLLPAPELYSDDGFTSVDTVPVRALVRTPAVRSTQIRELQPQTKTVQPAQNVQVRPVTTTTPVIRRPAEKQDTALIRRLTETFKVKPTVSPVEKRRIKLMIDSVYRVSTENPKVTSGDSVLNYGDLVRIIDSLLKANKKDSEKVIVDTIVVPKTDTPVVDMKETKTGRGHFLRNNWWLIVLLVAALAGLAFFILKRRKGRTGEPKIFFSYAWDQDEALIMQLYNSLKRDGFNVIKDKENMGYKGVISKFMNEIGSADFVIVAISDKYLKSKFCMYELYEIFRNSGMNRDTFGKKLFPIRIDESLDLGNPDTVNVYIKYWKEEEQEWTKRVKDDSDTITEEHARQYQFIKRLVIDVRNILSCLADINSLNLNMLKSNDFADVKKALREAMEQQQQDS